MKRRSVPGFTDLWQNSAILFCIAISCVVFWAARKLFLNQILFPTDYPSDLPAHISAALVGDFYSINSPLLRLFHWLNGYSAIASYLSGIVVLTMWAGAWMIKTLLQINHPDANLDISRIFVVAAPLVFLCSIYLPGFYGVFYYVAENHVTDFTQPWHNSTYLLMRLFSLAAMTYYFKIQSGYLQKPLPTGWIAFLLSLTLVNAAKPNFFIAFAPAALCFFVYDLIKSGNLKRIVWFGIPFLLSCSVLLLQAGALYSGGGEGDQSGIEISTRLFKQVLQNGIFLPHIVAGTTFVLFVTLLCIVHREGKRSLWFGWTAYFFSFLTRWFLMETGPRANHGNFTWGAKGIAYLLACICLERLIDLKLRKKISVNAFLVACLLLLLMVGSGVVYFVKLSQGAPYLI